MIHKLSLVPSIQRWITLLLAVIFSGFVAPVVEEMYFRGFLLPKMESLGVLAPVINALLFAIYHFFAPWNMPGIFIVFIPIVYAVWSRKNILIGIITHSAINLLSVVQLVLMLQTY
jgi:membrane protease YdiL (CAAX protease family)